MWWNEYIGVKFKVKGRDKDGVDCWGLVRLVYAEQFNIELPDYLECYDSVDDKKALSELMGNEKNNGWVEQKEPKEGDTLLLRMDGVPFHVGIYTKDGMFIHCERGANTNHAKMNSFRWRNSVAGIYRWMK